MKRIAKSPELQELATFRSAYATATWEQMKADPHFGGPAAYTKVKDQTKADQGGICAYCEIDLPADHLIHVEHFHPKSDKSTPHNWNLDWQNLLACCSGGSYQHNTIPGHFQEPVKDNLSCDAIKGDQNLTGIIHNPLTLNHATPAYRVNQATGKLTPEDATVTHLNLNCDRLCTARKSVLNNIEKLVKYCHQNKLPIESLYSRYFQKRHPAFYTTIRSRLPQLEPQLIAAGP